MSELARQTTIIFRVDKETKRVLRLEAAKRDKFLSDIMREAALLWLKTACDIIEVHDEPQPAGA